VLKIRLERDPLNHSDDAPPVDLLFSFHDALILLLLAETPRTKQNLAIKLASLGLDLDTPPFRETLRHLRRTRATKKSRWPLLELNTYGKALAVVINYDINSVGCRRGPDLPATELLAAIIRLEGRVDLSALTGRWDLVGGLTLVEVKDFHATCANKGIDFDDWLNIGTSAGCMFWYEGHLFVLDLPSAAHNTLVRSSTLFDEFKDQLEEAS
jgi:hypothetical protein